MRIATYQPDTTCKSNPNPNPTTKQYAIVNIQLNIVTCPTYPEKFIRDIVAPSVLL